MEKDPAGSYEAGPRVARKTQATRGAPGDPAAVSCQRRRGPCAKKRKKRKKRKEQRKKKKNKVIHDSDDDLLRRMDREAQGNLHETH